MTRIEPPKTIEDFEKILITTNELLENPWMDPSMLVTLQEKKREISAKIMDLKKEFIRNKIEESLIDAKRESFSDGVIFTLEEIEKSLPTDDDIKKDSERKGIFYTMGCFDIRDKLEKIIKELRKNVGKDT